MNEINLKINIEVSFILTSEFNQLKKDNELFQKSIEYL